MPGSLIRMLIHDTLSADKRKVRHLGRWVPMREGGYTMRFRFWGIPLPTFGQTTSVSDPRTLQLALRLTF